MNNLVTILSCSPRNDGNCVKIGDVLRDFHKQTNVRLYSITAENYKACSGCNYECLTPGAICPSITPYQKEVMDAVKESDLVYMIVPNFCGHPCANFYAYNERCIGYFNGDRALMGQYLSVPKKFIVVSNTESETFYAALKQQVNIEPDMLYLKTGKYKKRSTAGDLIDSEDAVADLMAFVVTEGSI